jgi:predicted RNA binding protein YcfA (HicA-like mRNA interferase family)
MKVRDVIRRLEEDGWYLARTKGSHRQFKHPVKVGTVTVPGKLSKDLAIGTLMSIWKQAQVENE